MKDLENKLNNQAKSPAENFVEVVVVTTSGSYPASGFERTPIHQKVRVILDQAARVLRITDTTGWQALADGRELDIDGNYLENGLSGKVEIDYGPSEGGGGDA